jgi:hypothetical protein
MLRLDFGDKQVPTKMASLSIAVNKKFIENSGCSRGFCNETSKG